MQFYISCRTVSDTHFNGQINLRQIPSCYTLPPLLRAAISQVGKAITINSHGASSNNSHIIPTTAAIIPIAIRINLRVLLIFIVT